MCNCFEETLVRLEDHVKSQIPADAEEFEIDWEGRALFLSRGEYAPCNPKVAYSFRPMKRDGTLAKNKRKETVNITASHCAFCGEKYARPDESDVKYDRPDSEPDITLAWAAAKVSGLSDEHNNDDTANEARAGSAWVALKAYVDKVYGAPDNEPAEQGIRDLLGDLMHLSDQLGLDFEDLKGRARRTYKDELENPLG